MTSKFRAFNIYKSYDSFSSSFFSAILHTADKHFAFSGMRTLSNFSYGSTSILHTYSVDDKRLNNNPWKLHVYLTLLSNRSAGK